MIEPPSSGDPRVFSSSRLHNHFMKTKASCRPVFHLVQCHINSLVPCFGKGGAAGKETRAPKWDPEWPPSSLLCSQLGDQGLSGEQEAKKNGRETHPERRLIPLVPQEQFHVILMELVSDLPKFAADLCLDAHGRLWPLRHPVVFLAPSLLLLHRPLSPVLHGRERGGEVREERRVSTEAWVGQPVGSAVHGVEAQYVVVVALRWGGGDDGLSGRRLRGSVFKLEVPMGRSPERWDGLRHVLLLIIHTTPQR